MGQEQEETKRKVISLEGGVEALGWSPPGFESGLCHLIFEGTLL